MSIFSNEFTSIFIGEQYGYPDLHGEWYAECTTGTHKAVDRKTGVGAYCKPGASRCVTPYSWVK